MACTTYELDGYRDGVAIIDVSRVEGIRDRANHAGTDLEFVARLLLGNAGLRKQGPERILCDLDSVAKEQLAAFEVTTTHRFRAFEIYLRATQSTNRVSIPSPVVLDDDWDDGDKDRMSMARRYVDDLRSIQRILPFLNTGTIELYKVVENALYDEIRTYTSSLSKEDLIGFNDHLSTTNDVKVEWGKIHSSPNALAVLYNFSPFTDTGAVVASKRIRETGDQFDVIGCSFANRKKIDNTIERIAAPYVVTKTFIPMSPSWSSWNAFKGYAIRSAKIATLNISQGKEYDYIYTRAMWAPSHYAGALIKKKFPSLPWVAEFSDPLSLDVEGLPRGDEIPEDLFASELLDGIEEEFGAVPPTHRTIFAIAEILAYARADRILFTNHHQQTTMLEHIYSEKLRRRVAKVAEVSNHPTLPKAFYDVEETEYSVDPTVINLAYFGEFYATRGLTEVTTAIRMLPSDVRDKIHLHVFTNYIPAGSTGARPRGMSAKAYEDLVERAISGVGAHGIERQVHLNGSLPYLKFLGITKKFDYLLVNDAQSGAHHVVNPYLPSKWSDYAGSTASSWAFVEEGSSLAGKPATVKTALGDIESIAMKLNQIISDKLGSAP